MVASPLLIAAALIASAPVTEAEAPHAEEDARPLSAREAVVAVPGASLISEPVWGVPLVHGAGLLVGMRASLYALSPNSYPLWQTAETRRNVDRGYTLLPLYDPHRRLLESDGSPLLLNTVGHGAFGSELYQRARTCRVGPIQSFVFTALGSALWEYAFELPYQRPSALDLMWTPLVGAAVGELRFQVWRLAGGGRGGPVRPTRRALMILVDPFGEAERALGTSC